MKRILSSSILLAFSLIFFSIISYSQDITGIWRGYFITDGGEQYKLEFQVKQNSTLKVTGVSYSYLDIRFYGKATMTGIVRLAENRFQIQELRTVEVKTLGGGGTCLMIYNLTFSQSGKEEFLEGSFLGKSEDRKNPANNGKWGDCGGGTVYLRKVPTSDFYIEPFLKNEKRVDTTTAIIKPKTTPPVVKNPPVKTNTQSKKTQNTQTDKTVIRPKPDSSKNVVVKPAIKDPSTEKKTVTIPNDLKNRENALAQTITVNTDELTIKLYDNGEIDDDTISVYVDKQLVLSRKRLSASPIVIPLKFENDGAEHEVVMVAENLGRIPPNTSLMIINAADKHYKVQITSTEQKNAMVRFKYVKP